MLLLLIFLGLIAALLGWQVWRLTRRLQLLETALDQFCELQRPGDFEDGYRVSRIEERFYMLQAVLRGDTRSIAKMLDL